MYAKNVKRTGGRYVDGVKVLTKDNVCYMAVNLIRTRTNDGFALSRPALAATARTGSARSPVEGGVDATPPHEFFWAARQTVWSIMLKFSIAYGVSFAQLLVKKIWSGQVRSRSYDVTKGTTFGKISAKSWVNATWRGAIDLNGDSWCDWCQYMTSCDPWPCITWVSRSSKVTRGHWPRLTSQWPIANRHMISGVSWGAESESVVHWW